MVNPSILIVEDEPVIALDIKRRLLHQGYTVVAIAHCSQTALAATAHYRPQLVLMDIRLKGEIDGITTAARMHDEFGVPVVFLTAHADATTLESAKATQPFGYIVKPFETHDLITTVEIALNRFQAEGLMRQALQRERELNDLKSQFVAIVSHEFRNPLSSILFSLDLLERQGENLSTEKKRLYIHRAKQSVARMKELLEDVLTMGEAEAGALQFHPKPFNLLQFCQELVDEFQGRAERHKIILTTGGCSIAEYTSFQGDEKLLSHIFSNLLSNAIKYSPQGGKIYLDLIGQPDAIRIRIQDCGIGIPAPDQLRLFDAFYRASNANLIQGTGLGLSIVKQCVDAHGGTISVESEVGVGTTFTVTLRMISSPQQIENR